MVGFVHENRSLSSFNADGAPDGVQPGNPRFFSGKQDFLPAAACRALSFVLTLFKSAPILSA